MRELKFRTWDKETEEFINSNDVLLRFDGLAVSRYALGAFDTFMPKNVIVEQYTGLKDKNGKEIYEGDIVKFGDSLARIIWRDKKAEFGIKWLDVVGIGIEDSLSWQIGTEKTPSEVIGNIHENPELLK